MLRWQRIERRLDSSAIVCTAVNYTLPENQELLRLITLKMSAVDERKWVRLVGDEPAVN
jgi:hypothetical protein